MSELGSVDQVGIVGVSQLNNQSENPLSSIGSQSNEGCGSSSQESDSLGGSSLSLTKEQKERIERNRQRALLIRESRQASKRAAEQSAAKNKINGSPEKQSRMGPQKLIDTGGGFLLEEEEGLEVIIPVQTKVVHPPAAPVDKSRLTCEECSREFSDSYLFTKFSQPVCDECKDTDDKHRLITRTDAKEKYLLKDADLDLRDPVLPFIVKKNPHNPRWGDMKLYLECQVAELASRVWGSDEALDEQKEKRQANRELMKKKRFDKKVKELRVAVRGSMYRKPTSGHEHEYGEENYNEQDDTYTKTCKTCGHSVNYEKM